MSTAGERGAHTHASLTEAYLREAAERGPSPERLSDLTRESTADSTFLGRCLSRPAFLGREEFRGLFADLDLLHQALTGLPDRLFDGDMAAFSRAVGMSAEQTDAIVRGRPKRPSRLCRADLYLEGEQFTLMELNVGSAIGGLDNAWTNRAMLDDPFIADFAARHGLTYIDTMAQTGCTIRTECGVADGAVPFVAVADWPASYDTLAPQLRKSADGLAAFGLEAQACSVAELRYADGRVWLEDRPVDIVYRVFMIEDLLDPAGPALIEPVLQAAERDEVAIFAPMDADIYGSKGALALLSDEQYRSRYSDDELAALDRILPWTRMVRPGPVTVEGRSVDLLQHAVEAQHELILKATLLHGGMGVQPGWTTDADTWRRLLDEAMDGPYVLQRRIHPSPEQFPTDDGTEEWTLTWGAFLVAGGSDTGGCGGLWMRGSREDGAVNMATGATATSCFHVG